MKTWSTHAIWWYSIRIHAEVLFHDCIHLCRSASTGVKSMYFFIKPKVRWPIRLMCWQCCIYYRDKTEHILGNVNLRQAWTWLWCRIKALKISNVQSLIVAAFAHFVVFLWLNFMKLSETMINDCCLAIEHYDLLEKPNSANFNLWKAM